jgi:hypothetical protein
MHQYGLFCIDFRAVTKWVETPQNMSFGSNRVDSVCSLRKIATQLRLANLLGTAPVRPVLHQFCCSNKTVRNTPKHEFWVKWSGFRAFVAKNCDVTSLANLVGSALVRPVLHRFSCSNKTIRNTPKHECWVKWSGFCAFVA